jgi:hypothetical protein
MRVVNNNSSQIHSFSTDEARISAMGISSLRTAVAFERPKRVRLQAGTGLTGTELDVGSNDELFWVWVKRQPPLYYCRHADFATSPARRVLPIEPEMLVEALGLVEFDPALPHQGPTLRPGGRLEIRTVRETADGPATKITLVDARTGVVVEQEAYDAGGQLVARAVASQHRRDPATALVMPGVVDIECAQCQLSMRIDLGRVQINRPMPNPAELWAMPSLDGLPMVDLGDPNLQFTPAAAPPLPGLPPSMARQTLPTAISSRLSHPLGARNRMLR